MSCSFVFRGFTSLFFTLSILWQEGLGRSALATGLLVLHLGGESAWDLTGPLILAGLGNGLVIAPNQDFVLGEVPREQAGTAGGALITAQRLGAAIGIAVWAPRCSAAEDRGRPRRSRLARAPDRVHPDCRQVAQVEGRMVALLQTQAVAAARLAARRVVKSWSAVVSSRTAFGVGSQAGPRPGIELVRWLLRRSPGASFVM
jgi:hypothetical protein